MNYDDMNPKSGDMNDFRHLVTVFHEQGIFVIIDWAANQTFRDYKMTADHTDYYSTDDESIFAYSRDDVQIRVSALLAMKTRKYFLFHVYFPHLLNHYFCR